MTKLHDDSNNGYNIFHNPKCKMTLFANRSILESALQLKVSFSLFQISNLGNIV